MPNPRTLKYRRYFSDRGRNVGFSEKYLKLKGNTVAY
ncbi:hypothetical protein FB545_2168 [Peribacillus frigoritolerans]|nr:hypothetical protein FB545_2168 [Peribacillus frigoritolerans]